jgi:hypothetical protein
MFSFVYQRHLLRCLALNAGASPLPDGVALQGRQHVLQVTHIFMPFHNIIFAGIVVQVIPLQVLNYTNKFMMPTAEK